MSKGVFRSHNKVGETMSIQVLPDPTMPFDPTVSKIVADERVSWDLDVGSGYTAGNSISYMFPSASPRTVTLRTNLLSTLNSISLLDDDVVGNVDLSGWSNLFKGGGQTLDLSSNQGLTGITHTHTPYTPFSYLANNCDLTGTLDLRPLENMGGMVEMRFNPNLNHILFSGSTSGFSNLFFDGNDLVDLDLSGFDNFATQFKIDDNDNLTGMTFYTGTSSVATSYFLAGGLTNYVGTLDLRGLKLYDYFDIRTTTCTKLLHGFYDGVWETYYVSDCTLVGNHDLTMFPTLGGTLSFYGNPNLTGITHTASSQSISGYSMNNCDITGTHILPFGEMGGYFSGKFNSNLTNIVHSASGRLFTAYNVSDCDLTGVFDLSMLSKLGGRFDCNNNPNLTNISHGFSIEVFTKYWADSCNIGTTLDVSMLSGLGGSFNVSNNTPLKIITFPYSTQTFANDAGGNSAFALNSCALASPTSGFDFKPLSGITMADTSVLGADVLLQNNGMTTVEVNEILVDFETIGGWNTSGWSGTTLNISGTNAAPDATTGGFDGIAAINTLTGTPHNWIITTS